MRRRRLVTIGALAVLGIVAWAAPAGAAEGDVAGHAEEECIHILEAGGAIDDCQEAPSPLLPETAELVWGGLAFLAVVGILGKFAFPALRRGVQAREEKIRGDLEAAESARAEAQSSIAAYERQLAEARVEAGRIIEESREAADTVRRDLIAAAESDAADVRARAEEDIRLATDRAMADLQARVAELSIELAERVVERNLDADTQRALIDSYIEQLARNN